MSRTIFGTFNEKCAELTIVGLSTYVDPKAYPCEDVVAPAAFAFKSGLLKSDGRGAS